MTPYPKKSDTPSRKNRKSARNKVFMLNRKESKLRREQRVVLRREQAGEEQSENQ